VRLAEGRWYVSDELQCWASKDESSEHHKRSKRTENSTEGLANGSKGSQRSKAKQNQSPFTTVTKMLFRQLTQGPANTRTNNGIFGFQTVALIYNWQGCMLIQINNGTPDLQTLVHLIWTRTGKFKHLQLSTLPFWPTCHAQSLAATNRVTEQLSWLRVERFYTSCSWSDKQAHRFSEGVTEQVPKQAHFSHLRGNYSHATSLNWNRHSFKLKLTLWATRGCAQV